MGIRSKPFFRHAMIAAVALVAAAGWLGASPAHSQSHSGAALPPSEIERMIAARGYRLTGPVVRHGKVYVANVLGPAGRCRATCRRRARWTFVATVSGRAADAPQRTPTNGRRWGVSSARCLALPKTPRRSLRRPRPIFMRTPSRRRKSNIPSPIRSLPCNRRAFRATPRRHRRAPTRLTPGAAAAPAAATPTAATPSTQRRRSGRRA